VRILQSGNANFGYVLAKKLRGAGIEADLLISRDSIEGVGVYGITASVNNPVSHDKDLKEYPEWIKFAEINKKTKVLKISKIMKDYDLIHAYQATPVHAMFSGRPYIAAVGGDEMRIRAFERSPTGIMLRRSYKKANRLVYSWPILKPYVKRLGLENAEYVPRIWDVSMFEKRGFAKENAEMLTFFLPTAEVWSLKGNEKFLGAFARLCKEGRKVFLYYVDWGGDSAKAKKILSHNDVKGRVEVIPGPVSREIMAEYMEKSDIVVDQFNSGSFTRVGIEAFLFGIPLLINLDEEVHREVHGESPRVINGKTEDEIYDKIICQLENRHELAEIAEYTKRWAMQNFDVEKNVKRYVEMYEGLLRK